MTPRRAAILAFSASGLLAAAFAIQAARVFAGSPAHSRRPDFVEMSQIALDQETGQLQDIPSHIRALDGQRVTLTGEIYNDQYDRDGRMTTFELVYSISDLPRYSAPKIQNFVLVKIPRNTKASMQPGLWDITGILHVRIDRNPDPSAHNISRVYTLDFESMSPSAAPRITAISSFGRSLPLPNRASNILRKLFAA